MLLGSLHLQSTYDPATLVVKRIHVLEQNLDILLAPSCGLSNDFVWLGGCFVEFYFCDCRAVDFVGSVDDSEGSCVGPGFCEEEVLAYAGCSVGLDSSVDYV